MTEPSNGLHRALIESAGILVLVGLIGVACFKVAVPFLVPFVWAVIITLSTWGLYLKLVSTLKGRRKIAALIMALLILLVFALPVSLAINSVLDWLPSLPELTGKISALRLGEPPAWLIKLPLVGERIENAWREGNLRNAIDPARVRPMLLTAAGWLIKEGANMAMAVVYLILATIMAGFLYVHGENAGQAAERFTLRIGGASGLGALHVAAHTMQGVFLGIIGTALLQAILSAIGFALAGVPGAAVLGLICFMTAVMQIGTGLIWIPTAIWLFHIDSQGWAAFTVVWGIFINTIDNFIKPYFISKTSGELPILLIFVGVIGGFLAWGFLGIFLGATLLAVAYTVFGDWLSSPDKTDSP
ncbi:AI-2E family transporter [Methylococcus sp. EFPC2]|uniref:AI-2E family transporter n=1 Tax=Methylococcus sp. EFPC2 TaxID=2812648 RepID=UPI001966FE7B|nr:AI-2E family transporter [Methylococcus sp. EFPC2]QSA97809.1 AI-2E family transporter [Methylococcus sp. EFPC2]